MAWYYKKPQIDYSEFNEDKKDYSPRELENFADALLRQDSKTTKGWNKATGILFDEHYHSRQRREVYTAAGVPDETITSSLSKDGLTMFNRTHPQGRKVNSEKQRKEHGASFYR